ncbi:hypothetical protein J42TS3_19780 [Paenibacillus vini]|uniref:DUF4268 domain-containing protein n=2 Tax=Paenibacillus vini TaxID=1476024 RepID=A0ABQ4MAJ8_9BACL|nr:hypothetical protein J42TS3_19780 [Paenibacillus vini]
MEEVTGLKLGNIAAEEPFGRRKIDLLSVDVNRRIPVFIETQINPSDVRHLNTVLGIVESASEGVIIWLARCFQKEHLDQVVSHLKRNKQKYIAFHAIKIHDDTIAQVELLNQMYKLDIWHNLDRITQIKHAIKKVFTYDQIPPTHTGRTVDVLQYDLTRIEDVNRYLLECLRSEVPCCLNVWKSKKFNSSDSQLSLGGGKSGITFKLSVKNQQGFAAIFLHFDANQIGFYQMMKRDIQQFRENIHTDISASNRKIGVTFEPDVDLDVTISKLASIFKRMLKNFGTYLYGDSKNSGAVEIAECDLLDEIDKMRKWVGAGLPGVRLMLENLLLEEVDNEQAFQANRERLSECLMRI